jgi:ABC-type polysaccharide/polyol phosphate export permease
LSRDLKVKYQRSLLGVIWTLINPLLVSVVLITVFSWVVRIPIEDYWAFLLSGYFAWNFIQQCIVAAGSVFQQHAALRKNIAFPTEILVFSAALSRLVEFLAELTIVTVLVCYIHHQAVPSALLLLPLAISIQVLIALGFMFPISVMSVLLQDLQHALPTFVLSLFYVSPVLYPLAFVPEIALPWYYLNPLVLPLELYHAILYQGAAPSLSALAASSVGALIFCFLGYLVFRRYKGECIESA